MKHYLLKTMLLLCILVGGVSSAWAGDSFVLATSLSVGDQVVLVNTGVTKELVSITTTGTTYGTTADISNSTPAGTYLLTVVEGSGSNSYAFKTSSNTYLSWSSGNSLTTTSSITNASSWSVSINNNGEATITNVGTNTRKLQYNASNPRFACYTTNQTAVKFYKKQVSKTASDLTITNTENTINLAIGGTTTGDITYTTSSDGTMSFVSNNTSVATVNSTGTVTAVGEGSTTITVSQTEGTSYAASGNLSVTVHVSDARTAVGSITAISPTTVYIGQIDDFTLTQSMTGTVSSYAWSLGDGEDEYLTLSDETFEGLKEGDVTVTVTATPTDASTYKPVTASFPISVAYKYSAPTISKSSGDGDNFSTSTNVTLDAVAGATVYYTTDGTIPTNTSTAYSTPFEITATTTINAIAIDNEGLVSPVATETYTKVAVVHTNISLEAAQTLSFDDFSGIGSYSDPKSADFIASDGDKYTMTGKQFGYYSNGCQFQKSNNGYFTSGTVTSPNGFVLTITTKDTFYPTVKFGSTDAVATSTSADGKTKTYSTSSTSTTFTLTASTSGTAVATAIILTANKATNTITATTARSIDRTNSESSITLDATSTSGSVTYAIKSSSIDAEDYVFNTSTGVLTVTGTYSGTIVITASSDATSGYLAAEDVDITVTVIGTKSDPTIVIADDNVNYGETYTLDVSGFASGAVTMVSGNTAIATIDNENLTITPVAVGVVTITVNTAESALYNSSSETFELTVNAPTGGTTIAKGTNTSTVTLDFTDNTEWQFPTSKTVDAETFNDGTYSITLTGSTGEGYSFNTSDTYLLLGKNGASLQFQAFDKFVTQIDVTGRSNASGYVTQNIYVGDNPVSTETTGAKTTNEYVIAENYQAPGNIYTLKVTNSNNTQITEIVIHFADVKKVSITTNASGYASYCSKDPLDFTTLTSGAKAYVVSSVDGNQATLTQITEDVKGGVGIIIKGSPSTNYQVETCSSSKTPTNALVGTLAPKYVTEVDGLYTNFGLVGNEFKKITGTVPANKAYLPILTSALSGEIKSFNLVFDDTTGISTMERVVIDNDVWYDLQGRRIAQPSKGIYIHNGKKVFIK